MAEWMDARADNWVFSLKEMLVIVFVWTSHSLKDVNCT